MTDTTRDTDRTARTLGEMSHTNPHTGDAFGDTRTYDRGRTVAADGGRREADTAEDADRMRDVDHTPPNDSEGVNHVYDTGAPRDEDE